MAITEDGLMLMLYEMHKEKATGIDFIQNVNSIRSRIPQILF
jgi:hypothetical protein